MNSNIQHQVDIRRTQLLYANGALSNVTIVVACSVSFFILWGAIPPWQVIGWYGYMVSVVALRAGLLAWHGRSLDANQRARFWARYYIAATVLLGVGWTFLVVIGFSEDIWIRMLIVLLVVGVIWDRYR